MSTMLWITDGCIMYDRPPYKLLECMPQDAALRALWNFGCGKGAQAQMMQRERTAGHEFSLLPCTVADRLLVTLV
eukprot:3297071-Amphidinium_carterae.1